MLQLAWKVLGGGGDVSADTGAGGESSGPRAPVHTREHGHLGDRELTILQQAIKDGQRSDNAVGAAVARGAEPPPAIKAIRTWVSATGVTHREYMTKTTEGEITIKLHTFSRDDGKAIKSWLQGMLAKNPRALINHINNAITRAAAEPPVFSGDSENVEITIAPNGPPKGPAPLKLYSASRSTARASEMAVQLQTLNAGILPLDKIPYMGWLTREGAARPMSSIVVEFSRPESANRLIHAGCLWPNETYSVERYDRNCRIKQCFRCQKYGHITTQCAATHDTCGFCSDSHDTRKCPVRSSCGVPKPPARPPPPPLTAPERPLSSTTPAPTPVRTTTATLEPTLEPTRKPTLEPTLDPAVLMHSTDPNLDINAFLDSLTNDTYPRPPSVSPSVATEPAVPGEPIEGPPASTAPPSILQLNADNIDLNFRK
ncbi:hypothetical protein PG993_005688 [Apiospora rasikravindrae]|uniref:CCHC-type domain-containing protein n=1 Tax=Apiospora rasikravindrae TaxID=990691 RepID=A0ABR1TIU2_9PEZI